MALLLLLGAASRCPAGEEPPLTPPEAAAARALWLERGEEALAPIAAYYDRVSLSTTELQPAFDLAREIAGNVRPGSAGAPRVTRLLLAFLRLEEVDTVKLPGEVLEAPWHVILRLIFGLRTAEELGPPLLERARLELERSPARATEPLRNAAYGVAYLRYRPGAEVVRRFAQIAEGASLTVALDLLSWMGDEDAAPFLEALALGSRDPTDCAGAARALREVIGDRAEATLHGVLARDDLAFARGAVEPLLAIGTPGAIQAVLARGEGAVDTRFRKLIDRQIEDYARALELSLEDLKALIGRDPEEASRRMTPFGHRMTYLLPEDPRLQPKDLEAVLREWTTSATLYTSGWAWVRDRHVVDAARPEDLPRLEALRIAILRDYRTSSVNEAEVVQRMLGLVQKKLAQEQAAEKKLAEKKLEGAASKARPRDQ